MSRTEGPWRIDYVAGGDAMGNDGPLAAMIVGEDANVAAPTWGGKSRTDVNADARLIAAAPELLDVVERLEGVVDDLMGEISGEGPVQDWGAVNGLLVDANAAIAKASDSEEPA